MIIPWHHPYPGHLYWMSVPQISFRAEWFETVFVMRGGGYWTLWASSLEGSASTDSHSELSSKDSDGIISCSGLKCIQGSGRGKICRSVAQSPVSKFGNLCALGRGWGLSGPLGSTLQSRLVGRVACQSGRGASDLGICWRTFGHGARSVTLGIGWFCACRLQVWVQRHVGTVGTTYLSSTGPRLRCRWDGVVVEPALTFFWILSISN